MHLETGDTGRFDLKGYHYLLYRDMPGAVVAREYNKNLSIFQMDLDGNLTLLLEPYLYTEAFVYGLSSLPATALAYYDGWLYYFLDFHYQDDFTLARTDGKTFSHIEVFPVSSAMRYRQRGNWHGWGRSISMMDTFISCSSKIQIAALFRKSSFRMR